LFKSSTRSVYNRHQKRSAKAFFTQIISVFIPFDKPILPAIMPNVFIPPPLPPSAIQKKVVPLQADNYDKYNSNNKHTTQ
jgi:hypothetical protein